MEKIWENLPYPIMEFGGIIIGVFLIVNLFQYLSRAMLPRNPGSLLGIGFGALIGMTGIAVGPLPCFAGIALGGLIGGLLFGGIYWYVQNIHQNHNEQMRAAVQPLIEALRPQNEQPAIRQ